MAHRCRERAPSTTSDSVIPLFRLDVRFARSPTRLATYEYAPYEKIDSCCANPLTSTVLLIAIESFATDGGLHMVNLREMKFVEMPAATGTR
jgi:hypothetical protein